MRRLFFLLMMICTTPVWADSLDQLYKVAGWPEQRAHFTDALDAAQQRYRNSLRPPFIRRWSITATSALRPKPWTGVPRHSCAPT